MNKNLTEIVLIVDTSGSMHRTKEDACGGINSLIAEHTGADGRANLTLAEFSGVVRYIHDGEDISKVKKYNMTPSGSTALLDAIGFTVQRVGKRLSETKEKDRPGLVLVAIVTDGAENSSNNFSQSQISEIISEQENKYNWKFTFLGANQDSFLSARGLNMSLEGVANYSGTKEGTKAAYTATSGKFMRMREAQTMGLVADNSFTSEEKENMINPRI